MVCPQCGGAVSDGARFCDACGREVAPALGGSDVGGPGSSSAMIAPPKTSGKAIASLIFGIVPLSILSSIPAVVFGHLALSEIKKSAGRLGGRGSAIAGLILGYLGLAMFPLMLIVAAIAIPNLLRARIAANESYAVSAIRTINTAELSYQSSYPKVGFASDLESMGPGGQTCGNPSQTAACLIEYRLASASETPRNGYFFSVHGVGDGKGYVASAMPVARNQSGVRSFCSIEDGMVHVDMSGGSINDAGACAALPTLD